MLGLRSRDRHRSLVGVVPVTLAAEYGRRVAEEDATEDKPLADITPALLLLTILFVELEVADNLFTRAPRP